MNVIDILINLIVYGLVFYLLFWLIGYIGLQEPFGKVARVILALGAVIVIICILFGRGSIPRVHI